LSALGADTEPYTHTAALFDFVISNPTDFVFAYFAGVKSLLPRIGGRARKPAPVQSVDAQLLLAPRAQLERADFGSETRTKPPPKEADRDAALQAEGAIDGAAPAPPAAGPPQDPWPRRTSRTSRRKESSSLSRRRKISFEAASVARSAIFR